MNERQNNNKLAKTFYFLEDFIATISMVIILLFVLTATILRYIFNSSIFGLEELTVVIALYCYFIGASCSSREGSQIKVNIIDEFMNNSKYDYIFYFIRTSLSIIINIIFLYVSITYGKFVLEKNLNLSPLGVSKIVTVASLIVGFFLISVHETIRLINYINSRKNKNQKIATQASEKGGI